MNKRAVLGEVELSAVLSEDPIFTNEITDKPVEKGINVTDHARNQPINFTLEGVVTGKDAADKVGKLREYARECTLLKYVGRNIFGNFMIQELKTTHNTEVGDGFKFTIRMKEIRFAQVQTVLLNHPNLAVSTQGKGVGNKGKQQPVKGSVDDNRKGSTLYRIGEGASNYLKKVGG